MGILRGRKHGMSEELLSLVKWLAVVIGCGMLYRPVGEYVARTSPFSLLAAFVMAYVGVGLVILSLFGLIRHSVGGKLIGSDIFGKGEYYLGMGSGVVRFLCVLVAGLALLNSRYFPPSEVADMERFQNDVYGSNFFPTWHTVQEIVFERSLAGPWIKNHLSFLLIQSTLPEDKQLHQKEVELP